MSRTFKHTPLKVFFDWEKDEWQDGYSKYSNIKNSKLARYDRRQIRHSKIDEENIELTNAICNYKKDHFARNRYW